MLSNCLPMVVAIIAILNGIIAVFVAQFPLQTSRQQYGLLAIIAVLDLAAVISAMSAQKYSEATKKQQADRLRYVREQLGEFLQQGSALLRRARNESEPFPIEEMDRWTTLVSNYLEKTLGVSFVYRFADPSGIPMGFTSLHSHERRAIEDLLQTRMARLQQFLFELTINHISV
jgi:hypothetical protein